MAYFHVPAQVRCSAPQRELGHHCSTLRGEVSVQLVIQALQITIITLFRPVFFVQFFMCNCNNLRTGRESDRFFRWSILLDPAPNFRQLWPSARSVQYSHILFGRCLNSDYVGNVIRPRFQTHILWHVWVECDDSTEHKTNGCYAMLCFVYQELRLVLFPPPPPPKFF